MLDAADQSNIRPSSASHSVLVRAASSYPKHQNLKQTDTTKSDSQAPGKVEIIEYVWVMLFDPSHRTFAFRFGSSGDDDEFELRNVGTETFDSVVGAFDLSAIKHVDLAFYLLLDDGRLSVRQMKRQEEEKQRKFDEQASSRQRGVAGTSNGLC